MTLRVLLCDDQQLVRAGLRTILEDERDIEVVGEAASGEEAVAMAAELEPDLVLMDINLPGINGIEACRRITQAHPNVRIILLSTYTADDLPSDALDSGAKAYINKDEFGPQVLQTTWDGAGASSNGSSP